MTVDGDVGSGSVPRAIDARAFVADFTGGWCFALLGQRDTVVSNLFLDKEGCAGPGVTRPTPGI
jgi:hypothetical protein